MTSKIPLLRRGKEKKKFPLSKRGLGGFELFLLRHCEERLMRRGNLIYQNILM